MDSEAGLEDADLIVAADGANSRTRLRHAGRVRAGARPAQVPLHLARHHPDIQGLHLRLRAHRAWLVPDPRLPVQPRSLHGHRRDARGDLEERTVSTGSTPRSSIAFCERLFARYLDGHALQSNANHLRGSAWLNFNRVHLQALARRQARADRRRGAYGPLLHRLRHQARHGGCDIADAATSTGGSSLDCGAAARTTPSAASRC